MQLPEISIRRPVFATVLSLLIVLVGVVSFTRLNVREYPKIDNPVVTVETKYTGASSAVVESQVTKVLEDSLSGIEGVDVITSISRQEQSQITVNFVLSRDADSAAADVRDKVSRVRQKLPQGIDEPVIAKVEADAFPRDLAVVHGRYPERVAAHRLRQPHCQAHAANGTWRL